MRGDGDGGTTPAPRATGSGDGIPQRPPVPWHFKLLILAFVLYLGLRIVQMLGWIGVTVKDIHNGLAVAIVVVNGVVAIWGLLAWWRRWLVIRGFTYLALLGWTLFLPQLLLGIGLYSGGHRAPTGWQHYIYGIGAVLGITAGSYYRRRLTGREAMVYGLICLFLALIAGRAYVTGHG